MAGGADVVLIPEFEYDIEEIANVCRERESGGQSFTIVVVAEGARPKGGEMAVQEIIKESPDPIRLGGICKVLETQLERHIRSEVRSVILGHVQRGGTPTPYDRNLATVYGSYAASMVADGVYGRMVALQEGHLTSIPLDQVAGKVRYAQSRRGITDHAHRRDKGLDRRHAIGRRESHRRNWPSPAGMGMGLPQAAGAVAEP